MSFWQCVFSIVLMAATTYLIRVLPLTLFRREIKSRFIKSFLYYVPYAVLAAMVLPEILYSTAGLYSAAAGLLVALVFAWFGRSLFTVALAGASAVLLAEWLVPLLA